MNDLGDFHIVDRTEPVPLAPSDDSDEDRAETGRAHRGARKLGVAALVLLAVALGYGAGRRGLQNDDVAAAAEQRRDFVPAVRVAPVQPAGGVGHWHDLPWQVWWPRQAVSGPQLVQAPTITQVSSPVVPQRVALSWQTSQPPSAPVVPPPSWATPPSCEPPLPDAPAPPLA